MRARPLRLLFFLGTRPEAVKVAPLVVAARAYGDVETRLVSSGQHPKAMLEVLDHFALAPDADLRLFHEGQTLVEVFQSALGGFAREISAWRPDVVVVQGDTTSALAGGLAAFYEGVPVAHVEAGLRTRDLGQPFPEEMNRKFIDTFASFLFPPTTSASGNLAAEGISGESVFVTGNTVVDSLLAIIRDRSAPASEDPRVQAFVRANGHRGRVLVTAHRRESWGLGIEAIAAGLAQAAARFPEHLFLVPLHPNPIVRGSFHGRLPENVVVCDPVRYPVFVKVLAASDLVVTDSGGVLEEATSLGKHVVVVRNRTERPEAVAVGWASVVGVGSDAIDAAIGSVLEGAPAAARLVPVFGDGRAGSRTIAWLRWRFGLTRRKPRPWPPARAKGADDGGVRLVADLRPRAPRGPAEAARW